MRGITHIRIDDRLIHGQVALLWSTGLGVNRIIVINDEVAKNEVQKTILRMAAQGKINTSILDKQTAFENISNGKYAEQKCMIILKNPKDALDLIEKGLDIKSINVGNLVCREDDAINIRASLKLTKEVIGQFKELDKKGVELTCRMVPDDKNSYLLDYFKEMNI